MFKNLFTVFGYTVQTHSIISILAIILGYGLVLSMTKGTKYFKHMQDFIIYGVIGAIIGARIWHVFVFQWQDYAHHPLQIFAIWKGGISIEGAIVGGVITLIVYSKKHKLNFFEFADYIAPSMIFAQGIGRIAELLAGDVFGRPTGGDFGIVFPKGTIAYEYYGHQPLWPAAVWESQGNFIIFAILFMIFTFYRNKLMDGSIFFMYIVFYYIERFLLEFLRGDSPRHASLTGGQWSAMAIVLVAVLFYIGLVSTRKNDQRKFNS